MSRDSVSGGSSSGSGGKRPVPIWLIVTILFLVVLASGSGIVIALRYSQLSQQENRTALSEISPTVAGTPFSDMSAIQLYQYFMSRTPTLMDPLDGSHPDNWDSGPGCQFKQHAFYLTASPSSSIVICFLRNTFVHDFALQVQVQFQPDTDLGEEQGCALLFRSHLIQQESYEFNMSAYAQLDPITGSVATVHNASLDIQRPGSGEYELKGWTPGSIERLNSPDVLTVIAIGSKINLYINTQPQLTIADNTFQGGQIGLVGNSTFNLFQGTFAVAFRNLKLWELYE